MKLDNTFSIRNDNGNHTLVEKVKSFKKDGKTPLITEKLLYYGPLYQCLIGYLNQSVNKAEKLTSVQHTAEKAITTIRDMEAEIKATFRVEVRGEKP